MDTEIRKLSVEDGKDIYDMLRTIPEKENGFLNSAAIMTFAEFKLWLEGRYQSSFRKWIIQSYKVPETTYWFYIDGVPAGFGKIRHFLTDALREHGGNIGYSLAPAFRGKGYGKIFLKLLLNECADMGMDKVLLTIQSDNLPSLRTAAANGGVVEKTVNGRCYVWIDISHNQADIPEKSKISG